MRNNWSSGESLDLTQRAPAKALARLILGRGYGVGDKLPPQSALLGELGIGNDRMCAAMRGLAELGVLERKTRRGTIVKSLEPLRSIGWTIGVAGIHAPERGPRAFYADLLYRLLAKLSARGCDPRVYFRGDAYHSPGELRDFPRLEQDVETQTLDALLILTNLAPAERERLKRFALPLCHLYEWECMPCAVLQDLPGFVRAAAKRLATQGCRSLLIANSYADINPVEPLVRTAVGAVAPDGATCVHIHTREGIAGGENLAARLLRTAAAERPDGIVFTDDYSALGAAAVFAAAPAPPPLLAAKTNRHLPLAFPLPVMRFEIDTDELAERAVGSILDRVLNPALPDSIDRVPVRAAESNDGKARARALRVPAGA